MQSIQNTLQEIVPEWRIVFCTNVSCVDGCGTLLKELVKGSVLRVLESNFEACSIFTQTEEANDVTMIKAERSIDLLLEVLPVEKRQGTFQKWKVKPTRKWKVKVSDRQTEQKVKRG